MQSVRDVLRQSMSETENATRQKMQSVRDVLRQSFTCKDRYIFTGDAIRAGCAEAKTRIDAAMPSLSDAIRAGCAEAKIRRIGSPTSACGCNPCGMC